MTTEPPELMIAGRGAAEWAEGGFTIGLPSGEAAFSADHATEMALKRFTRCIDPVATLVQMDIPTSQVVQSTTCWAISMKPSPSMSFHGGPAGLRTPRPLPAHMVVFLSAHTGRMAITRIWS
jgi:hypothetical protein